MTPCRRKNKVYVLAESTYEMVANETKKTNPVFLYTRRQREKKGEDNKWVEKLRTRRYDGTAAQ